MLRLIAAEQHESVGYTSPGGFGSSGERFQCVREKLVVLVEEKKPVAVTRSHPRIAISGKAAILRPAHVVETFSKAPRDPCTEAGRPKPTMTGRP